MTAWLLAIWLWGSSSSPNVITVPGIQSYGDCEWLAHRIAHDQSRNTAVAPEIYCTPYKTVAK